MANETEVRIKALEIWQGGVMVDIAVDAERRKHLDKRFDSIEGQLSGFKGAINKVLLGLALLVATEGARFILGGGWASVAG